MNKIILLSLVLVGCMAPPEEYVYIQPEAPKASKPVIESPIYKRIVGEIKPEPTIPKPRMAVGDKKTVVKFSHEFSLPKFKVKEVVTFKMTGEKVRVLDRDRRRNGEWIYVVRTSDLGHADRIEEYELEKINE